MANFLPNGSGGESLVERQAKINDACSSFIKIGFPPELFTIKNLVHYGYTERKFLELIKPISFIPDLGTLTYFFDTAHQSLPHPYAIHDGFKDFVYCIDWIKRELSATTQTKEMSLVDVALARMTVDSAAPLMQQHKRIQSAIDELKKRQMVLEKESARIDGELKLRLGPIYGYEVPSLAELEAECYLLYEKDCRSRRIRVLPKHDEMVRENLVPVFGGTVKDRHLIKFLNDPVRKELIETYFKGFAAMGSDGF